MTPLKYLLLSVLTTFFLEAIIYEDAEDKKTSKWKLLNANVTTNINNINDSSKKSRVIEFEGDGTKQIYELRVNELKNKKIKQNEYWLSWQMKFSEDFVIIVLVETNVGKHYLVYTPGIFEGYMQYGLGDDTTNGKWQTLRRNLQEDITYFDNRVKVVALKSFVLKGNGKIDNIMTQKINLPKKKKLVKKKKPKKVFKKPTNASPVISVRGAKLLQLNLGDAYVEEGVSAYDEEDGDINVVSMENIDSNEVGRYMVLYTATDSHGNMALDKRYVHVGDVKIEETKVNLDENTIAEDNDDNRYEEQIQIWEKKLSMRENELAKKEKKSNKN